MTKISSNLNNYEQAFADFAINPSTKVSSEQLDKDFATELDLSLTASLESIRNIMARVDSRIVDTMCKAISIDLKHTNFSKTYQDRKDAAHWSAFECTIQAFLTYRTVGCFDSDKLAAEFDYLTHMLKAFAAGDRFIVAKLAFAGGAA